jgi:hypothetical protein
MIVYLDTSFLVKLSQPTKLNQSAEKEGMIIVSWSTNISFQERESLPPQHLTHPAKFGPQHGLALSPPCMDVPLGRIVLKMSKSKT